jgi:hypothetical protein
MTYLGTEKSYLGTEKSYLKLGVLYFTGFWACPKHIKQKDCKTYKTTTRGYLYKNCG